MRSEEEVVGRSQETPFNVAGRDFIMIRRFKPSDLESAIELDREVFGGYDPAIFTAFLTDSSGFS